MTPNDPQHEQMRAAFEQLHPDLPGWEGKSFRRMSSGKYEFDAIDYAWQGYQLALASPQVTALVNAAKRVRHDLGCATQRLEPCDCYVREIKQAISPFTVAKEPE